MGHPLSNDRMGYELSLYQGKWYMPAREDVRKCIMERESHFNYRADNGHYRGAYQMSGALARGALWMMKPEIKAEMGDRGIAKLNELMHTPVVKWNRYWQDRAFWTIWRKGQGKSDDGMSFILHTDDYDHPIDQTVRKGEYLGWKGNRGPRMFGY